jgi:hypothetical protein
VDVDFKLKVDVGTLCAGISLGSASGVGTARHPCAIQMIQSSVMRRGVTDARRAILSILVERISYEKCQGLA